jgi:hypothetical protein
VLTLWVQRFLAAVLRSAKVNVWSKVRDIS